MSVFPRLVWAEIYSFLTYYERCQFRSVCKSLSRFSNNEPISYWLKRGDPICLNLGMGLAALKLRNGIYVEQIEKYLDSAIYKNLFIGGNIRNYNEVKDYMTSYIDKAYQYGHHELAKSMLNASLSEWSLLKYHMYTGEYDKVFRFSEYTYYNAYKCGVSDLFLSTIASKLKPKELMAAKTMIAIRNNDMKALRAGSITRWRFEKVFEKACQNNNSEMARYLLQKMPDINDYFGTKLNKICKLDDAGAVLLYLNNFQADVIYMSIRYAITGGHIWAIKKLLTQCWEN